MPDLSYFKITFPLDANGNDYTGVSYSNRNNPLIKAYESPGSLAGYVPSSTYSPYFFVSGNDVVFRAHCAGALTSANSYPRCELRERVLKSGASGNNASDWDGYWSFQDEHELNATFRITAVPNNKKEVCVLQIKGEVGSSSEEAFRLDYRQDGSDGLHLTINEANGPTNIMDYTLGQTIQARMYVNNGSVTIELDNLNVSGSRGIYSLTFNSNYSNGYFKAGCYTQSSIWSQKSGVAAESPTASGEVRFSALTMGSGSNGGNGTGLSATYFNNSNFTSQVLTRIDPTINFNWGSGSPASSIGTNTYSARWTGSVQANQSGTYTFYTRTDDGVRLWVNGQQLVNKWVNQGPTEWSGTISLTAGVKVPIVMEYYENTGGAVAQLSWAGPGVSKQIIPQANLYPSSSQTLSCTSGSNLALNKTIVSYSSQENSTNGVIRLNDGNTTNRWAASGFPQNAVIDLGGVYSVNQINLRPYKNRAYQFLVEGSTTSPTSGFTTMTNATSNTSGGSVISKSFSARGVRYVRLTITGVSGNITTWSSIAEFQVICAGNSRLAAPDVELPLLTYSPNPFGQKGLFVQVPEDMEQLTSIRVVDMLGRKIMEKAEIQPGEELFILQNVQTGLYLIQWLDQSNQVLQTAKVLRE
ncbi:MAG: PA14 domain-containing protein [Bacteroidia bacterium]|nr:PA14 domain-containing protein [Bacteroidia bacterium]